MQQNGQNGGYTVVEMMAAADKQHDRLVVGSEVSAGRSIEGLVTGVTASMHQEGFVAAGRGLVDKVGYKVSYGAETLFVFGGDAGCNCRCAT